MNKEWPPKKNKQEQQKKDSKINNIVWELGVKNATKNVGYFGDSWSRTTKKDNLPELEQANITPLEEDHFQEQKEKTRKDLKTLTTTYQEKKQAYQEKKKELEQKGLLKRTFNALTGLNDDVNKKFELDEMQKELEGLQIQKAQILADYLRAKGKEERISQVVEKKLQASFTKISDEKHKALSEELVEKYRESFWGKLSPNQKRAISFTIGTAIGATIGGLGIGAAATLKAGRMLGGGIGGGSGATLGKITGEKIWNTKKKKTTQQKEKEEFLQDFSGEKKAVTELAQLIKKQQGELSNLEQKRFYFTMGTMLLGSVLGGSVGAHAGEQIAEHFSGNNINGEITESQKTLEQQKPAITKTINMQGDEVSRIEQNDGEHEIVLKHSSSATTDQAPAIQPIIKSFEFQVSEGSGTIQAFQEMKQQLAAEYAKIPTDQQPEVVQHILNTKSVELAKEYGGYNPDADLNNPRGAESFRLMKGDKFIIDKEGRLIYDRWGDNSDNLDHITANQGDVILDQGNDANIDGKFTDSGNQDQMFDYQSKTAPAPETATYQPTDEAVTGQQTIPENHSISKNTITSFNSNLEKINLNISGLKNTIYLKPFLEEIHSADYNSFPQLQKILKTLELNTSYFDNKNILVHYNNDPSRISFALIDKDNPENYIFFENSPANLNDFKIKVYCDDTTPKFLINAQDINEIQLKSIIENLDNTNNLTKIITEQIQSPHPTAEQIVNAHQQATAPEAGEGSHVVIDKNNQVGVQTPEEIAKSLGGIPADQTNTVEHTTLQDSHETKPKQNHINNNSNEYVSEYYKNQTPFNELDLNSIKQIINVNSIEVANTKIPSLNNINMGNLITVTDPETKSVFLLQQDNKFGTHLFKINQEYLDNLHKGNYSPQEIKYYMEQHKIGDFDSRESSLRKIFNRINNNIVSEREQLKFLNNESNYDN